MRFGAACRPLGTQQVLLLCCCCHAADAAAVEELPHDDQGQLLRPGVVWFNENLDDAVIDRIEDELDEADLLLIIGEECVCVGGGGSTRPVIWRCCVWGLL